MIDPNFDPLAELQLAKHNINELIRAYNAQADSIKELLNQNRRLNDLVRTARQEVHVLRQELHHQINSIRN